MNKTEQLIDLVRQTQGKVALLLELLSTGHRAESLLASQAEAIERLAELVRRASRLCECGGRFNVSTSRRRGELQR